MSKSDMSSVTAEVPHGTLDLLVLKTLHSLGSLHGYAIARRIEQVSGTARLSQGAIYPALMRLEQQGWIRTDWSVSETNRKVKLYTLTRPGAKQLEHAIERWRDAVAVVAKFLEA